MNDRRQLEDLKIACLSEGALVTDSALRELGGVENLTVHEYTTTGGLPLKVAGLDINVPFDDWYCTRSSVDVDVDLDGLVLRHGGRQWRIDKVHPLPGYLDKEDEAGRRYADVAYTHIDRIRISPIIGCAYDCAFCDLPGRVTLHTADFLIAAAEEALRDERFEVRHLLISGGSPGPRDEAAFASNLLALVEHLAGRIEVDVMMAASASGPELVRRLVDGGVHGFALNLEIESEPAGAVHIRGKQRRSRPHFDETVRTAVDLLGSTGRVRSLVLPGLEPIEATLDGVRHIAGLGADPVLSPFRPAQGTKLERHAPVTSGDLRTVLDESRSIVADYGVSLGPRCEPCQHNTLTFPWDVP